MHDSILLRIALIISIIGLILLVIILKTFGVQEINISEAKELEEDENIKIIGVVERVTSKQGFSIIEVSKKETIKIIVFDKINLSQGESIEIIGRTQNYNGEKEIIAEKIVLT